MPQQRRAVPAADFNNPSQSKYPIPITTSPPPHPPPSLQELLSLNTSSWGSSNSFQGLISIPFLRFEVVPVLLLQLHVVLLIVYYYWCSTFSQWSRIHSIPVLCNSSRSGTTSCSFLQRSHIYSPVFCGSRGKSDSTTTK